jgi:carbon-monoxide dehydrogenase medium subunit
MIPAAFDYEVAESVDHAISLLGEREDAKLLAGGHSLLPLLRLRAARPSLLVDLGRLHDLSYVRDAGDSIAIGALTRHHDVATAPLLQEHNPLVSYAASLIGDPQVRHRGTIGGTLAHGDPASDLPAVVVALGGEIDIAGPLGTRTVAAAEFFHGVFETAVGPDQVVTEVRVPKLGGDHVWSYLKFRRRAQDWATVGVAAVARRANGGVTEPAIALVSMGATPLRAAAAEAAWAAGEADPGAAADEGTEPPSDTNGSAEYRRHLARVLVRRAVEEAIGR